MSRRIVFNPNGVASLFSIIALTSFTLGLGFAGEPLGRLPKQHPNGDHAIADHAANPAYGDQARGKIGQMEGKGLRPADAGRQFKPEEDRGASQKSSQAAPTKKAIPANRPGQDLPGHAANGRAAFNGQRGDNTRAKPASEGSLHPYGLNKPLTAPTDGAMLNKTAKTREQSPKPPIGIGASAPRPVVVRSQITAAVGLGELTTASARHSTAAINGSAIHRRY